MFSPGHFTRPTLFMTPSVLSSIRRGLRKLASLVDGIQELLTPAAPASAPVTASTASTTTTPPAAIAPRVALAVVDAAPTEPVTSSTLLARATTSVAIRMLRIRPTPSAFVMYGGVLPRPSYFDSLPTTTVVTAAVVSPTPTLVSVSTTTAVPGQGPTPSALALYARTGTPVLRAMHRDVVDPAVARHREEFEREATAHYRASAQRRRLPRLVRMPGEPPLPPLPRLPTHRMIEYLSGWWPCRCLDCAAADPTHSLRHEVVQPMEMQARLRSFGRGGRLTASTASAMSARLNDTRLTTRSWGRTRV